MILKPLKSTIGSRFEKHLRDTYLSKHLDISLNTYERLSGIERKILNTEMSFFSVWFDYYLGNGIFSNDGKRITELLMETINDAPWGHAILVLFAMVILVYLGFLDWGLVKILKLFEGKREVKHVVG